MPENRRRTEGIARELATRLQKVSSSLDRIIAEVGSTAETSGIYWRGIETRMKGVYEEARAITRDWVVANLPKQYNLAISEQVRRLKASVIKAPRAVDYKSLVKALRVKQTLGALLNETLSSFNTGFLSGEATLRRLTRSTQQVLLSEAKVNKAVERGFMAKGSATASKRRLRDTLMSKAVDGKYVTVVDRNGNPRQYDIAKYAEMVARTKLIEASSQGVMSTALEVGTDLVQISSHNTQCAICSEFEGKIFSISGTDPDFPPLEEEPGFHPNCQHSMTILFREALARDGTLDKYIAFSNGETEEHPTREGFIPMSERDLT